ncbi:50S ribosome-binding GTPase family protein [Cryptosporidium felis]|nr:50S ribosome-binding GTPase family protein [Cryptosporidium felis]
MQDKGKQSVLAIRSVEQRGLINISILEEIYGLYNGFKTREKHEKGRKRAKDNASPDRQPIFEEDQGEQEVFSGLYSIGRALNVKVSKLGRKATVMVIGNISAGKSTLINWLLQEHVQKTGMAIETCGISFVVSGKQLNEIGGETALMLIPELREIVERNPSLLTGLSVKTFPYNQGRLQNINFVDTPGLVDGDSIYSFDIDNVIKDIAASLCDLILVCIDPSNQTPSRRLLEVAKFLMENAPHKTRFVLTKMDEIPSEEDRIKVMCQVTQSLSSNIKMRHRFDLIPIFVTGAKDGSYLVSNSSHALGEPLPSSENLNTTNSRAKSGKLQNPDKSPHFCSSSSTLNRIQEVIDQIEKVVDRKVQDGIAALLTDSQTLLERNKTLILKQTELEKNREAILRQKGLYTKSALFVLTLMFLLGLFQLFCYIGPSLTTGFQDESNLLTQLLHMELSSENLTSAWLFLSVSLLLSVLLLRNVQKERQQLFQGNLKSLNKLQASLNSINSRAIDLHNSYVHF